MREIKFRAFDKFHKTMDEVDGYYFYLADGELWEIFEETQGYETYMKKHNVTSSHEVMQYTGLKDKNGKEIYEGDFLLENYHGDIFTWEVKWSNYGYFFLLHDPSGETLSSEDFVEVAKDSEVIGNIYENPELLT